MRKIVRFGGPAPIAGAALDCLGRELGDRLITWAVGGGPEQASLVVIEVEATSGANEQAIAIVTRAATACGLTIEPEVV